MKPNNVPCEFYVLMVKRNDGQVYADLAKTTLHIYLTYADAKTAMKALPQSDSWHVVKLVAYVTEKQS